MELGNGAGTCCLVDWRTDELLCVCRGEVSKLGTLCILNYTSGWMEWIATTKVLTQGKSCIQDFIPRGLSLHATQAPPVAWDFCTIAAAI